MLPRSSVWQVMAAKAEVLLKCSLQEEPAEMLSMLALSHWMLQLMEENLWHHYRCWLFVPWFINSHRCQVGAKNCPSKIWMWMMWLYTFTNTHYIYIYVHSLDFEPLKISETINFHMKPDVHFISLVLWRNLMLSPSFLHESYGISKLGLLVTTDFLPKSNPGISRDGPLE